MHAGQLVKQGKGKKLFCGLFTAIFNKGNLLSGHIRYNGTFNPTRDAGASFTKLAYIFDVSF
jgi:hypothetical protein